MLVDVCSIAAVVLGVVSSLGDVTTKQTIVEAKNHSSFFIVFGSQAMLVGRMSIRKPRQPSENKGAVHVLPIRACSRADKVIWMSGALIFVGNSR